MQTPSYFFQGDYKDFEEYFLSQPHEVKCFRRGEYLWKPGEPYNHIHYILKGSEILFADHESGRRKIISFHGEGTVFPGYRNIDFRIELSLVTQALTDMEVLEFTKPQFRSMFEANTALSKRVVDWYSRFVNLFIFETTHQEYNSSSGKLCNLLYLLTAKQPSMTAGIGLTQSQLSEILGLSRVQLTRALSELRRLGIISTSRGRVVVEDFAALEELCSSEAV